MIKKARFAVWFITIVYLSSLAAASEIQSASIVDIIDEGQSILESIHIKLKNNTKDYFLFTLPNNVHSVTINDIKVDPANNSLSIPLRCVSCSFTLKYTVPDVIKRESDLLTFSRTLNLPKIPQQISYEIMLPLGHVLEFSEDENDPPVVPQASEIKTDGRNIIVVWTEQNPELPKRYFVKYHKHDALVGTVKDLGNELSESMVWVIIFFSLLLGSAAGWFARSFHLKRTAVRSDSTFVPASLLSADEKTVLKLLQENENNMTQKDVGKELGWSKSKVSALMTNLEYKEIITREKFGRNYKVTLNKKIEL